MTTYPDIRRAAIFGATDEKVSAILLDIESGGGSVNGVSDTGNLISMINDNVKPVTAFTDGLMASAAYWLGSSAGDVYSSKTSVVGSIGVISTHMEISAMLKKEGVGVTVMRAGRVQGARQPARAADGHREDPDPEPAQRGLWRVRRPRRRPSQRDDGRTSTRRWARVASSSARQLRTQDLSTASRATTRWSRKCKVTLLTKRNDKPKMAHISNEDTTR